jgi:predicted transcriptional regulator
MNFRSRRRDFLTISVAILKAAKNGIKKTHILSSVSLSYEQIIRYSKFLKAQGFIEKHDTLYQTTEKGLKLIEEFNSSSLIRNLVEQTKT